ncbi:unnamed protein product [Linum trigynum]|uniref:Secreted protein n=1 Tax=Linum trigynum TaxID=586398 RepID=A0AAV2EUG9_9ROSI
MFRRGGALFLFAVALTTRMKAAKTSSCLPEQGQYEALSPSPVSNFSQPNSPSFTTGLPCDGVTSALEDTKDLPRYLWLGS